VKHGRSVALMMNSQRAAAYSWPRYSVATGTSGKCRPVTLLATWTLHADDIALAIAKGTILRNFARNENA